MGGREGGRGDRVPPAPPPQTNTSQVNDWCRIIWKTAFFHRFGGEIWFGLLSMCGCAPLVLVEIVNDIFRERIREKEGRAATHEAMPLTGAPLARAAHASSQGQQPREVRGVLHLTAATKQMRERAQLRSKHAQPYGEE